MTPKEIKDQEEFDECMRNEKPIISEFCGRKIYFFKNKTFADPKVPVPFLSDEGERKDL